MARMMTMLYMPRNSWAERAPGVDSTRATYLQIHVCGRVAYDVD